MTLGAALIAQGCAAEPAANGAEVRDAVASDVLLSDVLFSDALALDSGARDANVTADGGGASCTAPSSELRR
jgi:hypothetical protein